MNDEKAVSEVIGSIILIAILAMSAAVVIIAIETGPSANVQEQAIILNSEYRIEDDLLVISHNGGETLDKADIQILVDGTDHTDDFVDDAGSASWTEWKAGENRYYTSTAIPLGVQVIGTNPGYGDVLVYSSGDIGPLQTVTTATPIPTGTATPTPTPTVPPVAEFSANVTNGTAPLGVLFTDATTNSPTSWSWTFGDGGTSTLQNPTHTYTTAGLYNVSLTVENAYGNDTETKTNYINVTSGGGGAGNLILDTITRSGIFKEGSTLNFRTAATNGNNRRIVFNGVTTIDIGLNNEVVLVINSDQIGQIEGTTTTQNPPFRITKLEFSDVSLYDGGVLLATGSTALTSGNDQLSRITITESALTLAVPYQVNPTSSLTVNGVPVVTGNQGIILNNMTNDVDDDMDVRIVPGTPSTYAKVAVGSYELYSLNPAFTANVTSGTAPLAVAFTDSSTGRIVGRSWDFGGQGSSTAMNPVFTFTTAGNYTVNLSVIGPAGERINASQLITVVGGAAEPVGYWRFEDVTGALALDSSGNGNDGSIQGTYLQVPGASGNGLYFDGTDTYVSISDDSTLDFTTAMTLTAWVYPVEKTTGDVYNQYMHMIAGKGTDGNENFDFSMAPVALPSGGGDYTGKSFWFESQGGSLIAKGPSDGWPVVPPEQWSMLALVIDGSTLTYYLDGTPYATTVTSPLIPNNNPLYLGRQNMASYPLYFRGVMDEVSLYGEALSQAEITTLYNSITPSTYPPVAAFSANVTSGTAPLSVLFTDATTNSPTSWSWTFGDGGTSTSQNPVHTYTVAGTYTVTLTATNVYGSDTETKTGYITVSSGGGGDVVFDTTTRAGFFKEGSRFTFRTSAQQQKNRKIVFNGATTITLTRNNDYYIVINSDQIGQIEGTNTGLTPPLSLTTLTFSDVSLYTSGGSLEETGSIALTTGDKQLTQVTIVESALTLVVPYQVNPVSSLTVDGVPVATGNNGITLYNITNDVDDDMDVTIVSGTPSTYAKVAVGSYEF